MSTVSLDFSGASSGSFENDKGTRFTLAEITSTLQVEGDFAEWLSKKYFNMDENPILVLDFANTVTTGQRKEVVDALAKYGEKCPYLETAFKFDSYSDIFKARDAVHAEVPWAYYSSKRVEDKDRRYDIVPKVLTSLIVIGKKKQLEFDDVQFFKIL
uniref:Uncharacterized protein n=2 Tax=Meloidogyne TaxID=189290 RepID=A0A6V7VB20_MELEN|nr:unnamed protein product [Meloidogyne enterolobii]